MQTYCLLERRHLLVVEVTRTERTSFMFFAIVKEAFINVMGTGVLPKVPVDQGQCQAPSL